MKLVLQEGESECGISCLKMILNHYHRDPDIGKIKKYSGTLLSGTTMLGMKECLETYHIEAKGYEATLSAIEDSFVNPCILLCDHQGYFHYMVLEKISHHYFYLLDPSAGKRKMTMGELSTIYLGKVLRIENIGDDRSNSNSLITYLIHYACTHLKGLCFSFLLTLFFTFLSTIREYLFYGLLDDYTSIQFYILLVVMGVYLLIQKLYFRHLIRINNQCEKEIVIKSYDSLLKCSNQFFLSHTKEDALSKIESLEEFSTFIVTLSSEFLYNLFIVIISGGMLYFFHIRLFLIDALELITLLIMTLLSVKIMQEKQEKVLLEKSQLLGKVKRILYHLNEYRIALKDHFNADHYFEKVENCYQVQSNITLLSGMLSFLFLILILFTARKIELHGTWLFYSIVLFGKGNEAMNSLLAILISYPKMKILYERVQEVREVHEGIEFNEKITRITLENMTYSYGYTSPVFRKINLTLSDHYLIQGSNGRGKSTLLQLIRGYDKSYLGKIRVNNTELKNISEQSLNKKIVYVESEMTFDESSILMMVDKKWLLEVLKDYPAVLESIIKWNLFDLSAGKRQFVVFLYVLFLEFDVYLLDECFNHMDETFLSISKELLESELLLDKIVLCVEHNLKEIGNYELISLDQ